jgi:magnesium chelatase subunit I
MTAITAIEQLPRTLGELRRSSEFCEKRLLSRSVKDEIRENLIRKLRAGETLFPGILGYDDTVVPQIVNALLSKHNFILLGLRGQAKSRILRELTGFLDPYLPAIQGTEIHDNPYQPLSRKGRLIVEEYGDETPIAYLTPSQRYVEKLATPDVTIADMIGDVDPIKAFKGAHDLGDELTIHFGLLPRANRGIFAINELPDLMGKIQVGLFNIMQEGDVQIKGYPIRLPLDVLLVFTANPEDYTARGKIITPLKDRIGSEIRTHYPMSIDHAIEITRQEAWEQRHPERIEPGGELHIPDFLREIVETIAWVAREDKKIDKRSGVSQRLSISCMENVISNAERRAFHGGEAKIVPRVGDIYAALPSITGKFELEYEGELRGADSVAHELIRAAVGRVYDRYYTGDNVSQIVQWFEMGGSLKLSDNSPAAKVVEQIEGIQGLVELASRLVPNDHDGPEMLASAGEFVLDGLYAHRRLSRSEELGYQIEKRKKRETPEQDFPGSPRNPRRSYN